MLRTASEDASTRWGPARLESDVRVYVRSYGSAVAVAVTVTVTGIYPADSVMKQ